MINLGLLGKSKNARAEISRKKHRRMPQDLSYEADSGPKTKLKIDPSLAPLKNAHFLRHPKRNWDVVYNAAGKLGSKAPQRG